MSILVIEQGNVVKACGKEDYASTLRLGMTLGKTYAALALGLKPTRTVSIRVNPSG